MLNTFTATTDIVVFKLFKNFIRHIHFQQFTLDDGVVLATMAGTSFEQRVQMDT